MARFIAKVDIPPNVKAGDVVTAKEPLIPEFANLLEKIGGRSEPTKVGEPKEPGSETETETDQTLITNPDRNLLKDEATSLGINFAPNIPTDRLIELIKEARARKTETDETDETNETSETSETSETEDSEKDSDDGDE